MVRRALRGSVDGVTFMIHEAASRAAALVVLQARDISCVLLDVTLPDANGLAFLGEITVAAGAPPVIILTGDGDRGAAARAKSLGAHGCLVKGTFSAQALRRSIEAVAHRRKAPAGLAPGCETDAAAK